jgi:hypothetical protein
MCVSLTHSPLLFAFGQVVAVSITAVAGRSYNSLTDLLPRVTELLYCPRQPFRKRLSARAAGTYWSSA